MFSNVIPFIAFVLIFWLISQFDVFCISISSLQRRFLLLVALCLLIIFAGCRWSAYEVGYDLNVFDYGTYKNIYNSPLNILNFWEEYSSSNFEIKAQEPGYVFYSSLCHVFLGNNFNVYLLFTNFILIVLFYKSLINNEIKNCYLLLFFFFASRLYLQYNFILLRQAISISIIWFWGFPYVVEKKYVKYCLVVFFASLFHFTALISLLALFFNRKINAKLFICLIAISIFISITGLADRMLLLLMQSGVSMIGVSDGIGEKLAKYISDDESRKLNILTFVEAIPFGYIAMKFKNELCSTRWGRFYHNMFYIFILLLALTMNFGFLTRACQYFMFSYFFLLAFYFQIKKVNSHKKIFLFVLSFYFLVYSIRYIFIWFYDTKYSFFLFNS